MACIEINFDGANDPERCKCQAAVLRTFESLRLSGQPDNVALEAAKIVYSFHHPEDSKLDASLTVERWIFADRMH